MSASDDGPPPQNRGDIGEAERRDLRDAQGRYLPGNNGNPGGRPSTRWIREWLGEVVEGSRRGGTPVQRRQALVTALFATAVNTRHKDHVKAAELLLAYEAGKPIQAVELSGPEGGPFDPASMTSEQQKAYMAGLIAKARGEREGPDGDDGPEG